MGLTVPFAETLQSMLRSVFTASCVSLLLEIGHLSNKLTHGHGSGIFTPPLGRDEEETVHEDAPDC